MGVKLENGPALQDVIALMKDRVNTVNELANASLMFYREPDPDPELLRQHLTDAARSAPERICRQYRNDRVEARGAFGDDEGIAETEQDEDARRSPCRCVFF